MAMFVRSVHKDIYTDTPPLHNQRVKLTSTAPFTPTYVKDHVTKSADPAQTYASRLQGRQILLENPVGTSKTKRLREEQQARRLSDKTRSTTSRRDVQRSSFWQLKPQETKFQLFLPLHALWMGYMAELLALPSAPIGSNNQLPEAVPNMAAIHAKLVKADFHGSILTIRQSKNTCLVGLSGIVIHETENALKIVTRKDQLKLVPKRNSIFTLAVPLYSTGGMGSTSMEPGHTVLDLPRLEFELYGNQFCFRAAERAGRKFKHKDSIELR